MRQVNEKEMGMGRISDIFLEKWRLPGFLYADDFVFCGELEENIRVMMGCLVEASRRRSLKVNADDREVMVLNRK